MNPQILDKLDKICNFHYTRCYDAHVVGYNDGKCVICDESTDDFILRELHSGRFQLTIVSCPNHWSMCLSQFKIYKDIQINNYVQFMLSLAEISNRDIANIIIRLYYRSYGILRDPLSMS